MNEQETNLNNILLYGATGYSGSLVTHKAKERNINLILGGRDETKLKSLSEKTGFSYRAFSLGEISTMENSLKNISHVINIAGPFIDGLTGFVQCCIRLKIHFIDLAMDPNVLADYNELAIARDVMLLSGAGHAFLPIDCLSGFLHEKLPDAQKIKSYISGMNTLSHGTAKSNIALIKQGIFHRRGGQPYKIRNMKPTRTFLNDKIQYYVPSSFGVATIGFSTDIPDIESYFEATLAVRPFIFLINYFSWLFRFPTVQNIVEKQINKLPSGPTEEQLESGYIEYVATIENKNTILTAFLTTPEAYKTTYLVILHVLKKLDNYVKPGFQTPYSLFGSRVINDIDGFKLTFTNERPDI